MLSAIAAAAVPALGFALRSSRRNRLRQRITEYLELADELSASNAAAANEFRRLAGVAAELLTTREDRWLGRTIDPAAIAAILLLIAPAVVCVFLAVDWDSGWRIPVIAVAILWAIAWTVTGLTQMWKERPDPHGGHQSANSTDSET